MPYPTKTNPETILEAALEILEQQGEAALSMRALAEKLGIKAPSLYRHYADKQTLENAMVAAGTIQLHSAMEQAAAGQTGKEAVFAASLAYQAFAREHWALYNLIMGRFEPTRFHDQTGKALWNLVLRLVGQITQNPDDTAAAVALWAFLHGFSTLERSGMFGASGPKGGFKRGLGALLEGLSP